MNMLTNKLNSEYIIANEDHCLYQCWVLNFNTIKSFLLLNDFDVE